LPKRNLNLALQEL